MDIVVSEKYLKNAKYLLMTMMTIIIIGLMMVYSSSYIYARDTMGSSWFLIGKQSVFLFISLGAMFALSQVPFKIWHKNAYYIQWAGCLLLLMSLTSAFGVNIKGSHRWISIAGFTLQPGEFIKYSMLLCSLKFFEEFREYEKEKLWASIACLFFPLILLMFQPDFGTFVICSSVLFFCAFMSDFSRKYLAVTAGVGVALIGVLLVAAPYRVKRLLTFLDPWADPRGSGFQIIQSYLGFANGGVTGSGLGASLQKLFYLPESYNDFILSVLGEELGFLGVVAVAALFLLFVLFGFRLAVHCASNHGKIFISAVVFLIGIQAFLNMGVVLGLLPTKGLNLPFISYGGSSMMANLAAMGIVFSFHSYDFFGLKKRFG